MENGMKTKKLQLNYSYSQVVMLVISNILKDRELLNMVCIDCFFQYNIAYNEGRPLITDEEYDKIFELMNKNEPGNISSLDTNWKGYYDRRDRETAMAKNKVKYKISEVTNGNT
jgi:hypothetical protein